MPHFPVACSSKIVVVTAYFTCWLLFAFYTATLISALTCNKPHEITVQDVKDLQRDIGLADASVLELLKTTKDPLLKVLSMRTFTIWERKNYAASFCKQEWVYIGSKATLHRLLTAGNNTECDVQFSKETVYSISSHFTVKKDNVFSKRISKVIRKLHESGIIARLRKRLSQTKHKDKLEFVQIGISSLYGLLIIWGIGIVASLAAVLMERFL